MLITLDDLIKQDNGKGVDFDGAYGFQCVDLAQFYNRDVVGCPIKLVGAGAKDIWNTYPQQYYSRIVNGPTNSPQKGDLVIWNANVGGGYGHIAIALDGTSSTFRSFDQNFIHPYCEIITHNYTNVLGWLHPIPQITPQQKLDKIQQIAFGGDNDSVARSNIKILFQ